MADAPNVPWSQCRVCGYMHNTAEMADDAGLDPTKGDVSMCVSCGTLSVFDSELRLVAPSAELYDKMLQERGVRAMLTALWHLKYQDERKARNN